MIHVNCWRYNSQKCQKLRKNSIFTFNVFNLSWFVSSLFQRRKVKQFFSNRKSFIRHYLSKKSLIKQSNFPEIILQNLISIRDFHDKKNRLFQNSSRVLLKLALLFCIAFHFVSLPLQSRMTFLIFFICALQEKLFFVRAIVQSVALLRPLLSRIFLDF